MFSRQLMVKAADKIIVALDVPTGKQALKLVDELSDEISLFKVGLQLYTGWGPQIVRQIRETGAKVFLDLKLHDIPNTVGLAVAAASELGVQMLTIHLSGGSEMIRAAVDSRRGDLLILGVTVLTSANDQTLNETGVTDRVEDQVLRLAALGVAAGINGLVASPHEIAKLRAACGRDIKIVVPGIRPAGSDVADQKRVMTPRQALDADADYLVIGRPITAAADPHDALVQLLNEIE